MARRKKKGGRKRKTLPLISTAVGVDIAHELGYVDAWEYVKLGDMNRAMQYIGSNANMADISQAVLKGAALGVARQAFGKITLFGGKKFAVTLF